MEFVWCVKMVTMVMNVLKNVHKIVILMYVTSKMEGVTVLLDMQGILVKSVQVTVTKLDVVTPFIALHVRQASMVIYVTKHVQNTVKIKPVTKLVDVTVVLDMEAIPVSPVLRTVVTLDAMNN